METYRAHNSEIMVQVHLPLARFLCMFGFPMFYQLCLYIEQSFPLFFHLLTEWVLLACLPFFLLHRSFFAPSGSELEKKAYFFQLMALLRGLVVVVLVFALFLYVNFYQYKTADELLFFDAGVLFFRQDLFAFVLNTGLTLIILYYTYLVTLTGRGWREDFVYELPILLLVALISVRLLVAANDLVLILLALELMAFCSLILISGQFGANRLAPLPLEAAVKYFLINAVGVVFFLLGLAGYLASTHSFNLTVLTNYMLLFPATFYYSAEGFFLCTFIFFFSFALKIGAAPVHNWVPDVYEGAETLITAFLVLVIAPAIMMKFFLLFKLLLGTPDLLAALQPFFLISGLCGLVFGSFGAFTQWRVKRFLAYTGITHTGFIFLMLAAADSLTLASVFFYYFLYVLMNMVFFSLLLLGSQLNWQQPLLFVTHFRMLVAQSPVFCVLLSAVLFSFAGLPPFAGFFSKLFVLVLLLKAFHPGFALMTLVYVLISAYLYLRFIKVVLFEALPASVRYVAIKTTDFYRLKPQFTYRSVALEPGLWTMLATNWLFCLFFMCFVGFIPFVYTFFYQLFFYVDVCY